MWTRHRWVLVCAVLATALPHVTARAVNSEDGGTGLVHVDQAWALTGKGILFSSYAGLFSDNFTESGSRFLSLTPSVTKGLGAGFEISAALHLEGLSQNLEGQDFERRVDLRSQDLSGKLRWTRPLGTTRMRIGVQGLAGLPLESRTRTGGNRKPDQAFDPGFMGLLSTNVGWFDFPVRVHLNGGYWWSRDDGAFYYRTLPTHLPLQLAEGQSNDVFMAGVGVEVGLRRFELFAEVTTEHFWDARAQIRGSENLWRLTPGVRTMLTSTIAFTGALSIDLSKDAPETAFDPGKVYPDMAFRVGLSLGQVLGLDQGERDWRDRARLRKSKKDEDDTRVAVAEPGTPEPKSQPAAGSEVGPLQIPEPWEPTQVEAEDLMPPATAASSSPKTPTHVVVQENAGARAGAASSQATPAEVAVGESAPNRVQLLEERLGRLEMQMRMNVIEARLAMLEGLAVPSAGTTRSPLLQSPGSQVGGPSAESGAPSTPARSAPEPVQPAERKAEVAEVTPGPTPTPAPMSTPSTLEDAAAPVPSTYELQLAAQVQAMQRELQRLSRGETVVTQPPPSVAAPVQILMNPPVRAEPGDAAGTAGVPATKARAETPQPVREPPVPSSPSSPTPPPVALASVSEMGSEDVFPLVVGERRPISGVDLSTDNPPRDATTRGVLEDWAKKLARNPEVRITLLVHGAGSDRRRALKRTEAQAETLRDYLVVSGASPGQVIPLGMGLAEARAPVGTREAALVNPRVEIERTR